MAEQTAYLNKSAIAQQGSSEMQRWVAISTGILAFFAAKNKKYSIGSFSERDV